MCRREEPMFPGASGLGSGHFLNFLSGSPGEHSEHEHKKITIEMPAIRYESLYIDSMITWFPRFS